MGPKGREQEASGKVPPGQITQAGDNASPHRDDPQMGISFCENNSTTGGGGPRPTGWLREGGMLT